MPNGTYGFTVLPFGSFNIALASGSVVVSGQAVDRLIVFTIAPGAPGAGFPIWGVVAAVVLIAALALALWWNRKRHRKPPEPPAEGGKPPAP